MNNVALNLQQMMRALLTLFCLLLVSCQADDQVNGQPNQLDTKKIDTLDISQEAKVITEKSEIATAYEAAKIIPLPIEYTYELVIEQNDFVTIDDALRIPELDQLSDFKFAKLASLGKIRLLLVSGYMASGQSELYLFTLDDSFNIVNKCMLYSFQETEDGGVATKFNIAKDYKISIIKEQTADRSTVILEEKLFRIDAIGRFTQIAL